MKKNLVLLLILTLVVPSFLFAEDALGMNSAQVNRVTVKLPENAEEVTVTTKPDNPFYRNGLFFDGVANLSLIRKNDFMPGFSLNYGIRTGNTLMSLYGRLDYPVKPLGETSGAYVIRELKGEIGCNFLFVVQAEGRRETKVGLDIGYYRQGLEYARDPGNMYMVNNGLMLRPVLNTKVDLHFAIIELGIFYQAAVYPRYTGYDGVGVYLKLF
jgi:hypothetical protein